MAIGDVIVGIDIGTSKVSSVIAEINNFNQLEKMCIRDSPKSGTVTMDVTKAINEIKSGKVEYRLDKSNIIHLGFGKVSFGADKLFENYETVMDAIIKAKPAAAKGQYIKSIAITTTMGPSIYVG